MGLRQKQTAARLKPNLHVFGSPLFRDPLCSLLLNGTAGLAMKRESKNHDVERQLKIASGKFMMADGPVSGAADCLPACLSCTSMILNGKQPLFRGGSAFLINKITLFSKSLLDQEIRRRTGKQNIMYFFCFVWFQILFRQTHITHTHSEMQQSMHRTHLFP
jgi:hypothetical protein